MSKFNLDYFKDTNGKYIIKDVNNQPNIEENLNTLVKNEGEFSENIIISNKFLDKKLKHKINDTVKEIRKNLIIQNRITEKDIVSEKIILEIIPEEEFNPLFQILSQKEIREYTREASKFRITISWEIFLLPKNHLMINGIIGTIKNFFN